MPGTDPLSEYCQKRRSLLPHEYGIVRAQFVNSCAKTHTLPWCRTIAPTPIPFPNPGAGVVR